jgi:hypothetical protein
MDLPKDCIIKICMEMKLSTILNFVQTSKDSYNIGLKISNFKFYKKGEYKHQLVKYKKKQKIFCLLKEFNPINDKIRMLHGSGSLYNDYSIKIQYKGKISCFYSSKYNLYHSCLDFNDIMTSNDPNIKLEELRQQIYN